MTLSNILIIASSPDRGRSFAKLVQTFASCRVILDDERLENLDNINGIIIDFSIDKFKNRTNIMILKEYLGSRYVPMIVILPKYDEISLVMAKKFGATACLPILSEPISVISTLIRQIAPEKTLTDLIMEYSISRTAIIFNSMFEAGRVGIIDIKIIDDGGDLVVLALREGGLWRWLDLVQAHDDMTVRHCLLVAGLVANFAIHLGLSTTDRSTLVRAGLVHDVGKARIPLAILNKPGPLDGEEMAVMRTHAARGHEILVGSGMCEPVVLSATRHHHEMLDGSGYPDGLRGHQIGDAVRLLTVCDIYAALTECRPYRAALPQAEALQILRSMTPHKLERSLVEAFANSLGHEKISSPRITSTISTTRPLTSSNPPRGTNLSCS